MTVVPLLWGGAPPAVTVVPETHRKCGSWVPVCAWRGHPRRFPLAGGNLLHDHHSRGASRLAPSASCPSFAMADALFHPLVVSATALPASAFAALVFRRGFAARFDKRGRACWRHCTVWAWPSLLFWSLLPSTTSATSSHWPLASTGLAVLVIYATAQARPFSRWPARLLVTVVLGWIVAKLLFVHVVMPQRLEGREPRAKGQAVAAEVPAGATLYLFRLKDEGIMFYYGRPCVALSAPRQLTSRPQAVYCILDAGTGTAWPFKERTCQLLQLTYEQQMPIVLSLDPADLPLDRRNSLDRDHDSVPAARREDPAASAKRPTDQGALSTTPSSLYGSLARSPAPRRLPLATSTSLSRMPTLKSVAASCAAPLSAWRFEPRDGMEVDRSGPAGRLRSPWGLQPGDRGIARQRAGPPGNCASTATREAVSNGATRTAKKAIPCFPNPDRGSPVQREPRSATCWRSCFGVGPAWKCGYVPWRRAGRRGGRGNRRGHRPAEHARGRPALISVGRGRHPHRPPSMKMCCPPIFRSRIPVVSAVGHEIDLTIADQVADRRALTRERGCRPDRDA